MYSNQVVLSYGTHVGDWDKLTKRKRLIPIKYIKSIISSSWRTGNRISWSIQFKGFAKIKNVSLQGNNHSTILLWEKHKQRAGIKPRTPLTYLHVLRNIALSNLHRKRTTVMLAWQHLCRPESDQLFHSNSRRAQWPLKQCNPIQREAFIVKQRCGNCYKHVLSHLNYILPLLHLSEGALPWEK